MAFVAHSRSSPLRASSSHTTSPSSTRRSHSRSLALCSTFSTARSRAGARARVFLAKNSTVLRIWYGHPLSTSCILAKTPPRSHSVSLRPSWHLPLVSARSSTSSCSPFSSAVASPALLGSTPQSLQSPKTPLANLNTSRASLSHLPSLSSE
jgi:hypothetical protein